MPGQCDDEHRARRDVGVDQRTKMKASETHLGKILEGTNQFVVPLFQRPYTWEESRWKVLWSDLVELCEDATELSGAKPHFLGSIVTVPTRSVPEGVSKFLLIDGQQRLTTLQILLAALRDRARQLQDGSPSTLPERLEKSYLVNQFEEGMDHYKLLPTQTNDDRDSFISVIKGEASLGGISRIPKAYMWFQRKLRNHSSPSPEVLAKIILRRLSLVSIVLDHDDNPHLIFESLNYKGEPLTQGDLIRNYFLMRIPLAEQERLFKTRWEPMQLRLGDQLSEFVRHFLMRQGSVVKQGEIYRTLKDQTDKQTPEEISNYLGNMHHSALHYERLLDPSREPNPEIAARLRDFQQMDVGVSFPLLLNLYADYDSGKLMLADFCAILDSLKNFFIRRFICAVPTHGLNKVLPPIYNQAKIYPSLLEGVRSILSQRDYPGDGNFRHALINLRLYGPGERQPKAKLILESLERALAGKEQVKTESLSIEHIMPQTLSAWWQEHLGETWREVYETRLHSLGNLTLTGYNPELSNDCFDSKRKIFSASPIHITRNITQFEHWDGESIQRRGEELADLALKVWPCIGQATPAAKATAPGYTGKIPLAVRILDTTQGVTSWREVLQLTIEAVRENNADVFDEIVNQFPRLLSNTSGKLRNPRPLSGNSLYFETNLSAESIVRYCQQIIEVAGYSLNQWGVDVSPASDIAH
jgi:uncharacterized protein with ParB-like and HNH nuclease domain